MTINSQNYNTVKDLVEEWNGKVNKIGFQFHTPFVKDDPLWMPFGEKRTKVVEGLISLKNDYPDFVVNGEKQLSLMKGNWGGVGTTPVQCPSWAILSLDHMGRIKQPCLHRKCGQQIIEADLRKMRSRLLLHTCCTRNN